MEVSERMPTRKRPQILSVPIKVYWEQPTGEWNPVALLWSLKGYLFCYIQFISYTINMPCF